MRTECNSLESLMKEPWGGGNIKKTGRINECIDGEILWLCCKGQFHPSQQQSREFHRSPGQKWAAGNPIKLVHLTHLPKPRFNSCISSTVWLSHLGLYSPLIRQRSSLLGVHKRGQSFTGVIEWNGNSCSCEITLVTAVNLIVYFVSHCFHPSVHPSLLVLYSFTGGLKPFPATTGWEAGSNLDMSPVLHIASLFSWKFKCQSGHNMWLDSIQNSLKPKHTAGCGLSHWINVAAQSNLGAPTCQLMCGGFIR